MEQLQLDSLHVVIMDLLQSVRSLSFFISSRFNFLGFCLSLCSSLRDSHPWALLSLLAFVLPCPKFGVGSFPFDGIAVLFF